MTQRDGRALDQLRSPSALGTLISMQRTAFCLIVASFVVVACGGGVGVAGTAVGGPCAANIDCASTSRCETGGDFPEGMCVASCGGDADCPAGARCIGKKDGICVPECTSNAECRGNYECKDQDGKSGGKVLVCLKD